MNNSTNTLIVKWKEMIDSIEKKIIAGQVERVTVWNNEPLTEWEKTLLAYELENALDRYVFDKGCTGETSSCCDALDTIAITVARVIVQYRLLLSARGYGK